MYLAYEISAYALFRPYALFARSCIDNYTPTMFTNIF